MFTTGRLIFTILFIIAFILVLIYAYRKDLKINRRHFPQTYRVLLSIILITIVLFLVVKFKYLIMK